MNTKRVYEAGLPIVPYDGSHICTTVDIHHGRTRFRERRNSWRRHLDLNQERLVTPRLSKPLEYLYRMSPFHWHR